MAVVVLLALLATAGFKSYRDLADVRSREEGLERRIAETRERIDILEDYVDRIDEDPHTLERLAREELGLGEPGDVVIILPEETPPEGESEPAPPNP